MFHNYDIRNSVVLVPEKEFPYDSNITISIGPNVKLLWFYLKKLNYILFFFRFLQKKVLSDLKAKKLFLFVLFLALMLKKWFLTNLNSKSNSHILFQKWFLLTRFFCFLSLIHSIFLKYNFQSGLIWSLNHLKWNGLSKKVMSMSLFLLAHWRNPQIMLYILMKNCDQNVGPIF